MTSPVARNEFMRISTDIELNHGAPPDFQIRHALAECLAGLAREVVKDYRFDFMPMVFRVRLTFETNVDRWDFEIIARLKNALALDLRGDFQEKALTRRWPIWAKKAVCSVFGHKMAVTGIHESTKTKLGGLIVSCLRCEEINQSTRAMLRQFETAVA